MAGVVGTLSIFVAPTSAGLVVTALAAGGGCGSGGGGGTTPGPTQVFSGAQTGLLAFAMVQTVSGTTETDIFVTALQQTVYSAGAGPTSGPAAQVGITVFDISTGDPFVDAFGCTATPDFQINRLLTSASLGSTPIEVFDAVSSTTSTVTVSANWAGVGDVTRSGSADVFHSGNFTVTINDVEKVRNANAALSVSDATLGVDFDGAATSAELDEFRMGVTTVCVGCG